jgi:hypothetical protein
MKISELLCDESKWTKGALARDKFGNSIHPHDKNAVCWCLLGATSKCYAKSGKFKTMFDVLSASLIDSIADFNDHSTYEEVINFVKRFDI